MTPQRPVPQYRGQPIDRQPPFFAHLLRYLMTDSPSERASMHTLIAPMLEGSNEEMMRRNSEHGGVYLGGPQLRDLTVTTPGGSTAGYTVAEKRVTFIEQLRANSVIFQAGAQLFTDLSSNAAFPSSLMDPIAQWSVHENWPGPAGGESNQYFGLVTMRPKTLVGYVDVSRRLVKQTSQDVHEFIGRGLLNAVSLALEKAAVSGAGISSSGAGFDGEPIGVINTPGIGAAFIGPNGGPFTWDTATQLEWSVPRAASNGATPAIITNPNIRRSARRNFPAGSGKSLWACMEDIAPCFVSEFMPNTLTKGSGTGLNGVVYGNWADVLIGMWGGAELLWQPETIAAGKGRVGDAGRLLVYLEADAVVARPGSFAACLDAS